MDTPSVAESLPELYRAVLDRVADLETAAHRTEASLVRHDAITAYSRRWNSQTARRLSELAERADRVLSGRDRARLRQEGRASQGRRIVGVFVHRLGAWLKRPTRAATPERRTV